MSSDYRKMQFLIENFFEIITSIPKTLFFNFKVLPFKYAIKIPFIVSNKVLLKGINKENFIIEKKEDLKPVSMRIGFGDSATCRRESKKSLIQIKNKGKIIIKGKIGLSQGVIIVVDNANVIFGKNFRCNYSSTIDCSESDIIFDDDVVLGWNVTLKNNDGHYIISNGKKSVRSKPIIVGKHVWLCAYTTVLKGCNIRDNSVVAYKSLLTKTVDNKNVLYAGSPAIVIKENINWEE